MRFSRLAVEARDRTVDISFHPRFTVLTGAGSTTRESMTQELLGALTTHRSGTHLEIVTDAGRSLAIFRPTDAPHRVIDVASATDVTNEYMGTAGTIDMLEAFGTDAAAARRSARIGPNDLVASTTSQGLVARLGRIDQAQLWSDAQRVRVAKGALSPHEAVDVVEDASLTERIDHNYHAHDAALEQADQTRLLAGVVGTISLLGAALAITTSMGAAIALIAVAAAATVVAFVFRARVNYYARELERALEESGSESYLGYQLARIDGYTHSEHQRRHQAAVQADVDDALRRWRQTAGDVDVDWAWEHRPAIEAAAAIEAGTSSAGATGESVARRHVSDDTPELIDALITRFTDARRLGADDESFPLILDEPFAVLDPTVRPALLETLLEQAGSPQVILLTNSADIISWARLEEMTGALSIVGPGEGTRGDRPAGEGADDAGGTSRPRGGPSQEARHTTGPSAPHPAGAEAGGVDREGFHWER